MAKEEGKNITTAKTMRLLSHRFDHVIEQIEKTKTKPSPWGVTSFYFSCLALTTKSGWINAWQNQKSN
jgi:hypothetical protein